MKLNRFDNAFDSLMGSIISEATLEKMSKADQEAVNSKDPSKIKARINFWEKALAGDEMQKNGKSYKHKTCKMYIDFLHDRLHELEEKPEETPDAESEEESKDAPKEDTDNLDQVNEINFNVDIEDEE